MLDVLLDKMASEMTQKWSNSTLTPALAFWVGGLLALIHSQGWNWNIILNFISEISIVQGLFLAFSGLLLITVSNSLMRWFQLPLLQLVEGYWPNNSIKNYLINRQLRIFEKKNKCGISLQKGIILLIELN